MISEGIIIAIITGGFTLLGTFIQTIKHLKKNTTMLKPYHILNVRYEPPNSKNIDKYIDINKGNYKIKLPPCLKMYPSNTTGIVNVYKEYDTNFGKAELLVNIKKIKGDADLFIKRFDKDWNFVENDAINTQPLYKGINKMYITSKIGNGIVEKEQVGLMVYSKDKDFLEKCCICKNYNEYCKRCRKKNIAICNVVGANINIINTNIIS